jgi:hypothetical protein
MQSNMTARAMMKSWSLAAVALLVVMRPASARAEAPIAETELFRPKLGLSVLAGLAVPLCGGQQGECAGTSAVGPSLQGRFLYAPTPRWAFGIVGELTQFHWASNAVDMRDGSLTPVSSDLTAGFVGASSELILLPNSVASPVAAAALGVSVQSQTGSFFNCNDGFVPTGQLALGERIRLNRSVSLVGMASASAGLRNGCGISDGVAVPFVGRIFTFRAGATFDLPI